MSLLSRRLILAFSVLGLGASLVSAYVHYQLLTTPNYTSFCDVNETISCTDAYLSQYGSFLGVPVALGGVLFFAVTLLLAWAGGRTASAFRETAPAYIFAISTIGLAFVLYLAWASFFRLGALCPLCAITYVAVIAVFIISGGATTIPMTTLPGRAPRDIRTLVSTPAALVVALLLVAGAGAMIYAFPHEASTAGAVQANYPPLTDQQRADLAAWWEVQPKTDMPFAADAKVMIVKFSDYQCPACRQAHEAYKPLEQKYAGNKDVKFVLKHFPLEPECNPNVPGGNHFAGCEGAAAEVLARAKGTADKMNDWLFTNQATLTPSSVRQAAREVGGIEDFDAQYARALQQVKTDASMGGLLGVGSTPTFFINGRKIVGGYPPQAIEGLIELELKRAK
jgi:protein-disulfide isomerase/uncharacterized membrane protein